MKDKYLSFMFFIFFIYLLVFSLLFFSHLYSDDIEHINILYIVFKFYVIKM